MIDPDDPNVRMATFGRIVEDFLNGHIGTYLLGRAKEDEAAAILALKSVDAEDPAMIRKFQNQALVADKIIEWLADAIHQGQMSLQQLKDEHDGD